MKDNPFILPMRIMLAVGIMTSYLIDIPGHTLIGLTAYGPFFFCILAVCLWGSRKDRS